MSEMLVKLWDNGLLQMGVWETIYMTLLSTGFAYLFGLPMGVILWVTDKNGLPQVGKGKQTACRIINCVLGSASYSLDVSDIDGDGTVNVSDVTALINLVLNP